MTFRRTRGSCCTSGPWPTRNPRGRKPNSSNRNGSSMRKASSRRATTWPPSPQVNILFKSFKNDFDLILILSAGRRQCPGEALAKTEIFTLLSNVLQKYRIDLAEEHDWKTLPEGTFGVTYTPPPFRVVFRRIESLWPCFLLASIQLTVGTVPSVGVFINQVAGCLDVLWFCWIVDYHEINSDSDTNRSNFE